MHSSWLRVLATLAAGALTPLAFSPFGIWPLAILSPAVLMLVCRGARPKRAFLLGWLFGFGLFGAGVPWVYVSIHEFGGVIAPVTAVITVGFAAVLAVFPALACALAKRLATTGPAGLLLVWPASWVMLEWFRGWFLTGFPWLQLGYSQSDTWLAGWAPVSGVLGLGLVLMVAAGALAWAVAGAGRRRFAPLLLIPGLFFAGWALERLEWTEPRGEPLSVALLQGNFGQDIKWDREWLSVQLDWYGRRTLEATDADLVIWPETALPLFYNQLQVPYFSSLSGALSETDTALLAGMLLRGENDEPYNAIMGFGAAQGTYRKIHLVPLGEFFPFESLLSMLLPGLDIPLNDLAAGDEYQSPPVVFGDPVGLSICYEDAFGYVTRRTLPGAGLLVNVSNDAWFGDSAAPHQHLQIARMLALQSGRPLLRAANTGISAVIDHRGRIGARLDQFEQGTLRGEIRRRSGATPWAAVGDWPALGLAAAMLLAGGLAGRRARSVS